MPAEIMEKHGTGSDSDTALLYLAAIFKTTIHAVCSAAVSTTFDMQLSWLATVRYQDRAGLDRRPDAIFVACQNAGERRVRIETK